MVREMIDSNGAAATEARNMQLDTSCTIRSTKSA